MIYLILAFTLIPSLACGGNMNLPTVILTERLMIYTFIFIVALETAILYSRLKGLTIKQAIFISIRANLLTIFIVVPLVWGLWFAFIWNIPIELPTVLSNKIIVNLISAPITIEDESLLLAEWAMAPVYFIASYYLEYWFCRKKLKTFPLSDVKKAFFYANLASYLMIMGIETVYQYIITPYKALDRMLF